MHSAAIAHCSLDAINLRSHKFARRAANAFSSIKLFAAHSQNDNPLVYLANGSGCWSSISADNSPWFGKKRIAHSLQPVQSWEAPAESNLCNSLDASAPPVAYFSIFHALNPFAWDSSSTICSASLRSDAARCTTQNAQPEWPGNRIRSSTANSIVGG